MAKVVKNIDSVSHVYAGQTIVAGGQYSIQASEEYKWINDDSLLADIANGKAQINDGIADISGTANQINYLNDIDATPRDSDGSPLSRQKVTASGWGYQLHGVEFTTADRNSIYSKDVDGNDLGFATIKLYDSNNNEITTELGEADCVKTVVDWEPTYDYEIVGGMFKIKETLSTDMRLWVIGVPDVAAQYGGSKVFVNNVNLTYVGLEEGIKVDGRAAKYLSYNATYHTNKMRIVLKHNAGNQVDMHVVFEIFKA